MENQEELTIDQKLLSCIATLRYFGVDFIDNVTLGQGEIKFTIPEKTTLTNESTKETADCEHDLSTQDGLKLFAKESIHKIIEYSFKCSMMEKAVKDDLAQLMMNDEEFLKELLNETISGTRILCAVRQGDTWDDAKGRHTLEEMMKQIQFNMSFEDVSDVPEESGGSNE